MSGQNIPAVTFILQTPPSSTPSSSHSHVTKIVAPTVGVIGGLALVGLISIAIIQWRNRRRLRNGQQPDGYSGQGHNEHFVERYDGPYGIPYNG